METASKQPDIGWRFCAISVWDRLLAQHGA
ncbi:MAG: hypothetical protein N838_12915 [Thiohalocapsa sp. PB-PSB1]|nr:MAG: hypothetical protein N838_12915 [Thiohalocapsa sp. PB-PSB1]